MSGKFLMLTVCIVCFVAAVIAQKQPAATDASSVAWRAPSEAKPDDYVGAEVCAACHQSEASQFSKTVHARAGTAGAKYGTGCESCHGPGKAHAEAMAEAADDKAKAEQGKKLIFAFRAKPADNADRCLRCHASNNGQDFFGRSEHKLHGISCEQCHSPHLVAENAEKLQRQVLETAQAHFFVAPRLKEEQRWLQESLLKKPQPELCFTCHGVTRAQFALATHHRVPEGLMKCTDCHNAHGALSRPMLKKTNWEACVSCHVEKRGPFLFEHASVKVEGCTICHSPHGSVVRNLLVRREGRFLCLQCHVDPFAVNVPHGRLGFLTRGECVRCHASIHGSNINEFFLQ